MLTGLYRTSSERVENIIINSLLLTQMGFLLLKVANLSVVGWLLTFSPVAVLAAFYVSVWLIAKAISFWLAYRDTRDMLKLHKNMSARQQQEQVAAELNLNNGPKQ